VAQEAEAVTKDAFDQWWDWANKSPDDHRTIDVAVWRPISRLQAAERLDRDKVNAAVANDNDLPMNPEKEPGID
jgi:hypothetical protein